MPKNGAEYALSREKRTLDRVFATAASPAYAAAKLMVARQLESAALSYLGPLYEQKRIGRGHAPFAIRKLTTLHPDTNDPINAWFDWVRRHGVDEIAQIANIWRGDMSVAGYRPLIGEEFEETMDNLPQDLQSQWSALTYRTRPGGISSFAVWKHLNPEAEVDEAEMRAELDLKDLADGSWSYDLRLMGSLATHAMANRL